jgi:SAM-dependent methyltransferase
MNWVFDFYQRQDEWSDAYSGDIGETDHERAATIARHISAGTHRVLELGAGGGQTAAATAAAGHHVTAVEIVPSAATHAQQLAEQDYSGSLRVVNASFYDVELTGRFDVVCYWDGFGVGTDDNQRQLLHRIASWLEPHGCALIDIYAPWYWARVAGREMQIGEIMRRYGFDAEGCHMTDTWWPKTDPQQAATQSLRCYSPADLRLLLAGTGLVIRNIEPGGAVDYQAKTYTPHVPLEQAMQYLVTLTPDATPQQEA